MAKYHGEIGFATMVETSPGIWEEKIVKRGMYSGDILRNNRRHDNSQYLNDDIHISNQFSIIGDPYARQNFFQMRYLVWMGQKWKITNVDVSDYPRLVLDVGGLYNDGQ